MGIFDEPDRRSLMAQKKKRPKRFDLTQTAKVLEVPRQTVYYWIKKKCVMPPIKQGIFKLEPAGCFLIKSVHKIASVSYC